MTTSEISSVTRQSINSSANANISVDNHFVLAKCRRNDENEENNTTNNETDESEIEEKILAAYWRAGKLGAAYFTVQTGELFILDEIVDRPPAHQMLANLFRRVDPVKILVDGKISSTFVNVVKKIVFAEDSPHGKCKLAFIKSKDYNFEACKRRIYTLSLPNEPRNCTQDERSIFLKTLVNFSQLQSVHALGALLRYIDFNWANICMDLHTKPQFTTLRRISLQDIVTIDEDSYKGLQIFSSVAHPSNFKKGVQGSNKEGLSLYSIFNKCCSKVGQSRMRVLLQHPTNDINTLTSRQEVVSYFIRPQNDTTMKNICSSLRFIKNVNGILAKIKAFSAKPYQWRSLYNAIYNAVLVCEICESAKGAGEFVEKLGSYDNSKLYEIALYMNRIIDFDLSKTENKFTVKPGVDPELDRKKQTMASLQWLMSETAKVELSRLPTFIEECAMIYMPHLGYLLAVKIWDENISPSQKELPNMRFMFQNNDFVHYKTKGCEELDVMIGDTYPEIVAHETKIMMRLTGLVAENLHTLANIIEMCAELDCLIAIAKVSREHNFTRPKLVTDKIIDIKQGRHPLYSINCESFVPNDTVSNRNDGLVKILTGPNASGKSVYMKQIGLIVYLAHIGSFVPADESTIGLLTHIHTRIQSTECVAAHMSAFLIDLRQMSLALKESSSNSLIIIDEFGKGTAEVDGIALLASCVNSLLCREENCPHVFIATHVLQLPKYIVQTPLVKLQRFEHMLQDGEPVFLFRLTDGVTESSFAIQVAKSSGIEDHVINRASNVLSCFVNNKLPSANEKVKTKLRSFIEMTKTDLISD